MNNQTVSMHEIELAKKNGTLERIRSKLVEDLIGRHYTIGQQIAVLRQKEEKPAEYAAFCAYAEACKARVRAYLDDPVTNVL
ncbi:MAG: hypothetical protein IJW29_02710 [Clostridia bacterium]|nr:hypothetical protein [Clostridia bacterium]